MGPNREFGTRPRDEGRRFRRQGSGHERLCSGVRPCPCRLVLLATVLSGFCRESCWLLLPLTILYAQMMLMVGLRRLTPERNTSENQCECGRAIMVVSGGETSLVTLGSGAECHGH
jgi:hypothetical protein